MRTLVQALIGKDAHRFRSATKQWGRDEDLLDEHEDEHSKIDEQKWYKGDREKFSFLVSQYEPHFYWFELTEFARKFLLAGALIFCKAGSISQTFFGLITSLSFLLVVTRTPLPVWSRKSFYVPSP